ncbi:RNA polymerase-binding protein RbpA [Brevibacterium album]|uniref:RNA polymerase-binding protein RbpA n=1 Tax=Brevibacterium album TaxID=417948 RepID=UPI00040CB906|nr:RNA polymerase-binding protein RbpA [Brevibacterium album]
MSERSLRGTQLGSRSLESEQGVEPAPRQLIEYKCEDGHRFTVPFSVEADVPSQWDSGTHGIGTRVDGGETEEEEAKPVRTHWDMLLERRSFEELQVLLDERLEFRRSGGMTKGH